MKLAVNKSRLDLHLIMVWDSRRFSSMYCSSYCRCLEWETRVWLKGCFTLQMADLKYTDSMGKPEVGLEGDKSDGCHCKTENKMVTRLLNLEAIVRFLFKIINYFSLVSKPIILIILEIGKNKHKGFLRGLFCFFLQATNKIQ